MKRFQQALYGEPERALPALCGLVGVATGLLTRSWLKGACAALGCGMAWDQAARRLVIGDQRLGPVVLECPPLNKTEQPQVWLTFDDGPGPQTLQIVEALNQAGWPATFFFIGEQVEQYDPVERSLLANKLREGGHTVANHTWSHPNLLTLKESELEAEMERTSELLEQCFEGLTVPLFRPPFGYRNRQVFRSLRGRSWELVGWSLNSLDFLSGPAESVTQRVAEKLRPGSIVLFHDGRARRQRTVEALTQVIDLLKSRGFESYCGRDLK